MIDLGKSGRRLGVLMGLALALAPAAAAFAQTGARANPSFQGPPPPPSFPTALDRETLLAWLRRETDILPERVVAVTPQALTAVVSTFPGGGGQGPRVVIRAEALSAETYARTGALSWHVSLTADCAGGRVKLSDTTGYPERNLLGERKILRPAEADWRKPEPGTALESAWRAACDPAFRGPFAGEGGASPTARPVMAPTAPPPEPAAAPAPAPPAATKTAPAARRRPPAPAPAPPAPTPPAVTAPRGSVSVQVGAFTDQKEAQAAMDRLPKDRTRSLEQATVAGRTWYRLILWGFSTVADAQRFCDQRKAAGGACFVRVPKG